MASSAVNSDAARFTCQRLSAYRVRENDTSTIASFTISLDGYGGGQNQDINNPLGVGGTELHQWLFPRRTFQKNLFGVDTRTTGID